MSKRGEGLNKAPTSDMLNRKQMEEELAGVVEGMLEAVAIIGFDGTIRQVNSEFERGSGWKKEECVGKTTIELGFMSKEEGQKIEKKVLPKLMKEGFVRNIETIAIRRDGTKFPALMSWTLMKDVEGKPTGVITVARDITEQKQAEEALRQAQTELERRVEERTAELTKANEKLQIEITERKRMEQEIRVTNEELEAANEELRETQEQLIRSEKLAAIGQLAGGVGHELRNPLGAIKNAVYYIKGKVAKSELGQKEPRVMEFLEIMEEEINSSNKIINDLLGFSRVGKPSVSPTQIEKLIEYSLVRITVPENIELTKKLDADLPEVNIDPDQIQQVLVNVIANAVQAMPEGGKLTIAARERDRFLEVEISDTGGGIPQEAIDKIFDPLFTTKAKGIGLGLAVCKSIIDRHDGNLEVESEVGKGTTFIIKLPLKAE